MMKKWLVVLCVASAVSVMSGCGGSDEKVISGSTTTVEAPEGGAANESVDVQVQEDVTKEEQEETVQKGYLFAYGEVVVSIDGSATTVIEALGEPVSYFEAPSCAFEGLDKIYTYNSFEIDTYPVEGKDYVSAVILMDDSITTKEGVAIGESRSRVEEVYGTEYEEQGSMIVYHKDGMKLQFVFEGDMIQSIQYTSSVLDE